MARKLTIVVLSEGPIGLAGQTDMAWSHHPGLQGAGLTAHVPPVRPPTWAGQTGQGMPDDVTLTWARRPARDGELAGARAIGRAIGGHLRVEGNVENPLVLTTTSNGARRRPATRRKAAAARVDGDERAPVVGGGKGGAAKLPLTTAHLTAVTASGGDGGDGGATMPKTAGGGGGLETRRGGARRHGRARERGQTEEDDEGKLYMSSD
uniref:DUF834 domain-containing protein n=1 Tax=Oryza sativa TaxID=4530 RepID=Q949E4_ORYSA|nr:putative protein [Oryza sativa]